MQLKLTREGEIARQPSDVAGGSRVSKQRTLERSESLLTNCVCVEQIVHFVFFFPCQLRLFILAMVE